MTDFSDPYLLAKRHLTLAYNLSVSRKFSDAIREAWTAESKAREFAQALENERVKADAENRGT